MKNLKIILLFPFTLAFFAGVFLMCSGFVEAKADVDFVTDAAAEQLIAEPCEKCTAVCTGKNFDFCRIADKCGNHTTSLSGNCNVALPWNVSVTVVHGGNFAKYSLSDEIALCQKNTSNAAFLQIAERRGFYSGENGKRALLNELSRHGLPQDAVFEYILPGFAELVRNFDYTYVQKRDATVSFGKNGFEYSEGTDGVSVDKAALFDELLQSCGRSACIQLPLSVEQAQTVEQLRLITVQKGSFSTHVSGGANRRHNIALAAESLDGLTIAVGEKFSFNAVVGKRTEQNGYKNAKVILNGAYTDGIGGGVCQVSTTLYNALLLSEIVPRACQHSLVSSYVLAGFDAMVSDAGADLTFTNDASTPIYIAAKVNKDCSVITFCIYGAPNLFTVERQNEEVRTPFEVVEVVDRDKFPELIYTDQTKIVVNGSDGVETKSYLCFYRGDTLVCRRLIRQNTYKKVDKVVARGYLERDDALNET